MEIDIEREIDRLDTQIEAWMDGWMHGWMVGLLSLGTLGSDLLEPLNLLAIRTPTKTFKCLV